ncbi:BamA/TamA family outer membrane protein [Chryseobacterium sp. POL2]|uniref:translocation and assembly module lipoprotein TamL n=1 Tax=Chryseobacterium sp. POL2 TaxID=2713414 RepID=UPI0013E1E9D7|nr:BamA/TamA family outer membrane protein [Chryseobacterium sp. POL2]QIG90708.1 BamA/TamA family outer membrane protein [Chryseobacterium sp. POL2]
MRGKHFRKYSQKYYIFYLSASLMLLLLYACSTTKKVPDGEYLLTKNEFSYLDGKILSDKIPSYAAQKPNKKTFFLLPFGLLAYNNANPKYDSILTEYMTYPNEMRNQNLRDSLFVKYGHPEYKGRNLFWNRFWHTVGEKPVIYSDAKTKTSIEKINNFLVYKGYWDSEVTYEAKRDSAAKKAQVKYNILHRDPTFIKDYYYSISDAGVRQIYERDIKKSLIKKDNILDQTVLEDEVRRITQLMRDNGYYKFNGSGEQIYFTADTLNSRKQVPVTMDIHRDSLDGPFIKPKIGNIDIAVVDNIKEYEEKTIKKDSLRGIHIYRKDTAQYKLQSLWLPIIYKPGDAYEQRNFDVTKRNLMAMNNFTVLQAVDQLRNEGQANEVDSLIDVKYILKPLPKYDFKVGMDLHYSEILNFGFSPSLELTSRNIFKGAENLNLSFSGIVGTTKDPEKENAFFNAYELSAQAALQIPRLWVPFKRYWKVIPKRYSPTSSLFLGAAVQNNIGLGRISFNTGLSYLANVNDIVSHKLTLFNTQFSFTQNKDNYYQLFLADDEIRKQIFDLYFLQHPEVQAQFSNGQLTMDNVSRIIVRDNAFQAGLDQQQTGTFNSFRQSLTNKDRQTQDVVISSLIYNFTYNEIGQKEYKNPFYFSGKFEIAGNFLGLVSKNSKEDGIIQDNTKTIFKIPYSQFVKFDFDFRKYFTFFQEKARPHTLAIRQFVGIGIPYGNSSNMPFIRSYFNGGSNDIRAWVAFGGLGPADSQLDERVRSYAMDNVKLTTSIEYRLPIDNMFEAAIFTDAGNIWGLKDNGYGDQFKFSKFIKQMGVGSGFGLRLNVAYIKFRLDLAYKVYDPNQPEGDRWVIHKNKLLRPTLNFAFGYPF